MKNLSNWFPPDVKPSIVGVYMRGHPSQVEGARYWYWNGQHWEIGGWDNAEDAAKNPRPESPMRDLYWRGLAHAELAIRGIE